MLSAIDEDHLNGEQARLMTDAKNKLIAQAIQDVTVMIQRRDEAMLRRLIGLGAVLLEQPAGPAETVASQITEAGYEALLPERPRARARP